MRPGQQNKRGRGRGNNNNNNNRKPSNPLTRSYDSTGPEIKVRGTAQHVAEKYMTLARDAQSSGDRVMAENYLQHAEHYNRIIATAQAQQLERQQRDDAAREQAEREQAEREPALQSEAVAENADNGAEAQGNIDAKSEAKDVDAAVDAGASDAEMSEVQQEKPRRTPRRRPPNRPRRPRADEGDAGQVEAVQADVKPVIDNPAETEIAAVAE